MTERYAKCRRCGSMHDDGGYIDIDDGEKVFVCLECFDDHNAGNDARRVPCQRCGKLLDCMNLSEESGVVMVDGGVACVCLECLDYLNAHRDRPRYNRGTKLMFNTSRGKNKVGIVKVVDARGAMGVNEPSYDIFCEFENVLYKHVPESYVTGFFFE